jgi:hypothetical protein
MNPVTMVTCFFDINREENGDGRTIEHYKEWLQHTLRLNCNLYVVTEEKFRKFFEENRPTEYSMVIKVIDFKDLYFYKYYDAMQTILNSEEYRKRIAYPDRVECRIPEYNIIQYSKFHCLQMAIEENPYSNELFFWIDAGISRFFGNVDISKPYPSENMVEKIRENASQLIIQNRIDIHKYHFDDNLIWTANNLLYGTMFGGNKEIIHEIREKIEHVMQYMIDHKNINNEQLALAFIYSRLPQLFCFVRGNSGGHLPMFTTLAM